MWTEWWMYNEKNHSSNSQFTSFSSSGMANRRLNLVQADWNLALSLSPITKKAFSFNILKARIPYLAYGDLHTTNTTKVTKGYSPLISANLMKNNCGYHFSQELLQASLVFWKLWNKYHQTTMLGGYCLGLIRLN